jgi:hypothetical protein
VRVVTPGIFPTAAGGEAGGGGDPDPVPNCSIVVAQSGSPINGQSFTKSGIADGPSNNALGKYQAPGGWFNAVQYQVIATGDLNPADWSITQTATETGTQTVRVGNRNVTVPIKGITNVPDNPDSPAIFFGNVFGTLNVDWLDNPGQAFATKGGRIVSANLTFSFTASLMNTKTGYHCDVSWSFKLSF